MIQRNAVQSWTLLDPKPEILLFGDDEGTEKTAVEFGVKYMGPLLRNEFGTPLLNDLFSKAKAFSSTGVLCYVNCDIILMNDFLEAVATVTRKSSGFVMAGQRWNLDIRQPLDFSSGWQNRMCAEIVKSGELEPPDGIDYFVFPAGIFQDMPPFAIGRAMWDNWLLYHFRLRGFPIIDATRVVKVIHQRHDYSHIPRGKGGSTDGPESTVNRDIAGGFEKAFTLSDRTHWLTPHGLQPIHIWQNWQQRLQRYPVLHPENKLAVRIVRHWNWRFGRRAKVQAASS